jgi:hypothetical protein
MAIALSTAKKGSVQLFRLLEATFIKQRKAISLLKSSDRIANAYLINGFASEILLAAMSDPSIKVPALDKEIPRMHLGDETSTEIKVSH